MPSELTETTKIGNIKTKLSHCGNDLVIEATLQIDDEAEDSMADFIYTKAELYALGKADTLEDAIRHVCQSVAIILLEYFREGRLSIKKEDPCTLKELADSVPS